jgi:hypothetical protein
MQVNHQPIQALNNTQQNPKLVEQKATEKNLEQKPKVATPKDTLSKTPEKLLKEGRVATEIKLFDDTPEQGSRRPNCPFPIPAPGFPPGCQTPTQPYFPDDPTKPPTVPTPNPTKPPTKPEQPKPDEKPKPEKPPVKPPGHLPNPSPAPPPKFNSQQTS